MDSQIIERLNALRDEPVKPPSASVQEAMRTGRRRIRVRRATVGGITLIAVAAVLGSASLVAHTAGGPPHLPTVTPTVSTPPSRHPAALPAKPPLTKVKGCAIRPLQPLPSGSYTSVLAVDSTGRYAVGAYLPDGATGDRAVLWQDGVPTVLDTPGQDAHPVAVNSSGVVIGQSAIGDRFVDWVAMNGTVFTPTSTATGDVRLAAINDRGMIVGAVGSGLHYVSMLWTSPTAVGTPLPMPGPNWLVGPQAINDDSVIVGIAEPDRSGKQSVIMWGADRKYQLLPTPLFKNPASLGIANIDQRHFTAFDRNGIHQDAAYVFDIASGKHATIERPDNLGLSAGSGAGLFIGWLKSPTEGSILWGPGPRTTTLPTRSHNSVVTAQAISANGRFVGGIEQSAAGTTQPATQPVIWACH